MEFGVLGPLRVAEDGGELPIGSRTQRLVLASLLARLDEVVSVAALLDAVWGDDPPPSALNTLRSQVSRLRRLVGDRLAAAHEGYALRPEGDDVVDAVQFERALRRMRSDPGPTSRALLAAELAAWRGDAFGELADVPTVRAAARRLDLARIDAAELVAHADLLAGQWADAEAGAESILAVDPVREPAWEVLIRALGGAGRTAEAMRAARRAAAALAEAGLIPGPALRAAEADVLEAPAPAEATPHHQPARPRPPLTPTVGRSIELARALQALDDDRLVTVVGPGGVGKTRLAVDVAVTRADAHARGAILVELARVTDASGVASTIAAALDLRPTPGRELAVLVGLGSVDALIVLDNCEHVVDAVVAVVPAMLADGDHLRILATSREALAIGGEHVISLGPLATAGTDAPAIQLFRQRAAAAGAIDGENNAPAPLDDDLVRHVVARLDGLPLALEMAAARLRTMTLADVASSIDRDLDVLATSRRDVDVRHRTLRELLSWSERLLDEELLAAFHEFSVFAGPVRACDLPAAIRLPRSADAVSRLVDRSLVLAAPAADGVRYTALETVRSYGRERLREEGTYDAARRRHAEWFTSAVTELDALVRTVDEAAALIRFGEIFDELRAAMRWSLDEDLRIAAELVCHAYLPSRTGLRSEVVSWTADVLERLAPDDPVRPRVLSVLAGGMSWVGRLEDAIRLGEEARVATAGSAVALQALEGLADAATYQGRLDDAVSLAREAEELALRHGDDFHVDYARLGIALALAYGGDHAGGLAAVAGAPLSPAPSMLAWFEYARGETTLDRDPEGALEHLDRAVEIATDVGDRFVTEVALLSSSSLRARTGDLAAAVDRFSELLDHFGAGGDPGHLVTSLRNLVTLQVRLGQYRPAAALYGAVAEHPSSPTYGEEAQRLTAAAEECRDALGDMEFARVVAVGRARTLEATVDAAMAALRAARARVAALTTTAAGR